MLRHATTTRRLQKKTTHAPTLLLTTWIAMALASLMRMEMVFVTMRRQQAVRMLRHATMTRLQPMMTVLVSSLFQVSTTARATA